MPRETLSKRTRMLPCLLTDSERADRQKQLVKQTKARDVRESELSSWKAEKAEEQKGYEAEIRSIGIDCYRLARVIESNEELREVDVEEQIDGSTVYVVRLDTGEVLLGRAATAEELQRQLALAPPPPEEPKIRAEEAEAPEPVAAEEPAVEEGSRDTAPLA